MVREKLCRITAQTGNLAISYLRQNVEICVDLGEGSFHCLYTDIINISI